MRSLLTVFYSVFILIGGSVQAQTNPLSQMTEPAYQIDEQATAQSPWKPSSIIAEDNISKGSKDPVIVYRKFLGVTDKGYYVIQDFYQKSNRKQTDPLVIMQLDRVKDFVIDATPIQGAYIQWFDDGQKWVEGQYLDGKEQGLWTHWYSNGQKKTEGQYENGKQQGIWTWWHDNEQKEEQGQFLDGKRQGIWTRWDGEGHKISETMYEADKEISKVFYD